MTYVTESEIPFNEAFLDGSERFILLNMLTQGIWYVDTQHSKWQQIRQTALDIAMTFGDKDQIAKLQTLKPC